MSRPIAARLREVCAIVEAIGPCGSGAVSLAMTARGTPMTRSAAGQYCLRAVAHGLLEADRTQTPQVFTAVEEWRELADLPREPRPQAPQRPAPFALQAVW